MNPARHESARITPGVGWYWFAVGLFLVTAILTPLLVLRPLFRDRVTLQMLAPGTNQIRLKAGEYVLWHDYETIFQGVVRSGSSNLPAGLTFKLVAAADGTEVPMTPDANFWVRSSGSQRRSVGDFLVPTNGDYSLRITGAGAPGVFSLREPQFVEILQTIMVLIPVMLIGWIASPIILIVVAVKRSKSRRALNS